MHRRSEPEFPSSLQISGFSRRFLRLLSLRGIPHSDGLAGVNRRKRRSIPMNALNRRVAFHLVSASLVAAFPLATAPSAAAQDVPLAIQGYDPVAYFTDGKPTRGLPDFEYQWDEHRYRFASAEHRDLFKADPVRYAPQFGNFCAMALALGQIVVANPENWLISDGKLYVFGKAGPERTRACSRRTLPQTSPRRTRTGPFFPRTRGRSRRPASSVQSRPCADRRAKVRDRPRSETWSRIPAHRRSGRGGVSSSRPARHPQFGHAAHRRPPARCG